MLIKVPLSTTTSATAWVEGIVKAVSAEHYEGNLVTYELRSAGHTKRHSTARFMLRVRDGHKEPARYAASGRRTNAVTWEAHKLVMQAIFEACPEAIIVSALATYKGQDDFAMKHRDTYHHQAGSRMRPQSFGDL